MNIEELYLATLPLKSNKLGFLTNEYFNHIPEIGEVISLNELEDVEVDELLVQYIEVKKNAQHFWRLGTVWFKHKPVMIIQNNGYLGFEHVSRIVTDEVRYKALLHYILRFIEVNEIEDVEEDLSMDLSSFSLVREFEKLLN